MNAFMDKNRTGCRWRLLFADFPPVGIVRYYFDKWNADGTFIKVNDMPCKAVRKALDQDEEPSISVIDSQSTKTTEVGSERGINGGKFNGRKRQFWVDMNAFLLHVLMHVADVSDAEGKEWLLSAHHGCFPGLKSLCR